MSKAEQPEALDALIDRMRTLTIDHEPDGWPAVRMRDITALLEHIVCLEARVQELGQMARDCTSRRVRELEAQLASIGAGGVEPLRKCLHQISEPGAPTA